MIYRIHHRAKRFFELDQNDFAAQCRGSEDTPSTKNGKYTRFMCSAFDLLEYVPELKDLVFSEEEPQKRGYNLSVIEAQRAIEEMETIVSYDNKGVAYDDGAYSKAHNSWQQRKDSFEPIFTEPGTFVSHGQLHCNSGFVCDMKDIGRYHVRGFMEMGAQLNFNHPKIKSIQYFKEVMNYEKPIKTN